MLNHENNDFFNVDASVYVNPLHGFVVLKNLGATCYINSLLQQFYMNSDLRYFKKIILKKNFYFLNFSKKKKKERNFVG